MKKISIAAFPIRLGQFLKLSGAAEDGIHAKMLIQDNMVTVNGEPENRRGRQIFCNDIIVVGGMTYLAAAKGK